jgi:hypothetical protein
MIPGPSWLDSTSAWWAKADRAQEHLRSLRGQVEEFRASKPYTVIPEPTDTPGRTAYRLRLHIPVPVAISTTVGDVLHNLRSALDSLAYEVVQRGLDRPMTPEEARACAFPVCKTPEEFDQFFSRPSKNSRARARLYGDQARAALRSGQPFRFAEKAARVGVEVDYEEEYRWSMLHRLSYLSNVDKHRRLTVVAWWPHLVSWTNGGPTDWRWGGDGTFADSSILGYMVGRDADVSNEVEVVPVPVEVEVAVPA